MGYPTTFPDGCDDPDFNTNLTNHIWYAYTWFYSRSEIRTFTIGLPVVLIICVLGNGAFLYAVAKVKRLHTITNYYLATLALADVGFVISSCGNYLYAYYDSPVRYDAPYDSFVGCALSFGISNVMYYASLGLVTLVTFERYNGICFPLKHRAIASKSRTKKLIASSWLVGCILSCVRTLKYSKLERYCTIWPHLPDFTGWPQKSEFCVTIHENVNLLSDLTEIVPFFVALVLNGYMYVRIIYSLGHRELIKEGEQKGGQIKLQTHAVKIRKQVARMLVINGTLFFFCQIWIRINGLNNVLKNTGRYGLYKNESTYGTLLVFGRCMLYANSSLNPFVYNFTSSYYRDAFKEAFCGKTPNRREKSVFSSQSKFTADTTTSSI